MTIPQSVELCCGTKSFSKVAVLEGYSTLTFDNDRQHNPDVLGKLQDPEVRAAIPHKPDILWASPPCRTFSVASISTHWAGGVGAYIPKTWDAIEGLALLAHVIAIIAKEEPRLWFIENPRGVMRKVIDKIFAEHGVTDYTRHTITYCQYETGELRRMKPTDIWTNSKTWQPRPICKNGDPCHESAPRGAKTGTQGLAGHVLRGVIPPALFEDIFDSL